MALLKLGLMRHLAAASRCPGLRSGPAFICSQVNKSVAISKAKTALFSTSSPSLVERRFSEKHEWVTLTGDIGTVGVSQYAQEALGDVVYVQLPDVGSEFASEDEVAAVESVKAASEIYTPVSGKIVEINKALEDKPGLVNSSCYDQGWLFRIELKDKLQYEALMKEDAYNEYLKKVKHD